MNDKIEEILSFLLEHAQNASAFAEEQIPAVAREVIVYGRVVDTAMASVWVAAATAALYGNYHFVKWMASEDGDSDVFPLLIPAGIGAIITSIVACKSVAVAAKAWVAPRLYLIDYVSSLLN